MRIHFQKLFNTKKKRAVLFIFLLTLLAAGATTFYFKFLFINTTSWEELYIEDKGIGYEKGFQYAMKMKFPETWNVSNTPEKLNQNHDIKINTNNPSYSVSLHAVGSLNGGSCDFFKNWELTDFSCKVTEEGDAKVVTVFDSVDGQKRFVKWIYLTNRTYSFVAQYTTIKDLRLLKKVAKTFSADRRSIYQKNSSEDHTSNQLAYTNVGVEANTNIEENANATDASTANENTNTAEKIDTSDWLTYTNEEIGLKFEYPVSNAIELHLTDCSNKECDGSTGLSYYLTTVDQQGKTQFPFAGASTIDFQAGRDLGFYDVAFFKKDGDNFEAVLSEDMNFTIHPIQQGSYSNGDVVIYEIKELPSYPQLVDVASERKDDKVAIYNFNRTVQGFKSISLILTPEMTQQDIDRILNSVVIL